MRQNTKLFFHDLGNILNDKKTLLLLLFLTLLTLIIGMSICFTIQTDSENLLKQLKIVSNIDSIEIFSSYIIYIFSFIIFSSYPFILGILIISYMKEFGELELMMLFPLNRKHFFIEKIFCIFIVSLIFSWISVLINFLIQIVIFNISLYFDFYILFYTTISLPVWLLGLSYLTIFISSQSKDSKEANQKSLIFAFMLYGIIQILFIFKINIFSSKIVFVPFLLGIVIFIVLFNFFNKKITIEKILYNKM
ncbi:MAG: hypothetical protein J5527_00525 [Treponema sp.]|nr:hypothetical protein [Treponema sp.]